MMIYVIGIMMGNFSENLQFFDLFGPRIDELDVGQPHPPSFHSELSLVIA